MRRPYPIVLLSCFILIGPQLLEAHNHLFSNPVIVKRKRAVAPYNLERALKGKLEWELGEDILHFVQREEGVLLLQRDGNAIADFLFPEKVTGAITSENGRAMLVIVMNTDGYYQELRRIVLTEEGELVVESIFQKEHPELAIRRRWVSEVGAVSEDGKQALLYIGEADRDIDEHTHTYNIYYHWERWDLDEPARLGRGLKMSNAK